VKTVQCRQDAARVHVAGCFEWLADELDQLVKVLHDMTVTVNVMFRHNCLELLNRRTFIA
jgi:hypothetical protein